MLLFWSAESALEDRTFDVAPALVFGLMGPMVDIKFSFVKLICGDSSALRYTLDEPERASYQARRRSMPRHALPHDRAVDAD